MIEIRSLFSRATITDGPTWVASNPMEQVDGAYWCQTHDTVQWDGDTECTSLIIHDDDECRPVPIWINPDQ